jgi:Csm1 subunit domain B
MIGASLDELHRVLLAGQATGLDVLFETLSPRRSDTYAPARYRYPIVEVDPLKPVFPGSASTEQALLVEAIDKARAAAQTPEALLNVLERFGGFVAAQDTAGQEVGGVSWFDQARLAAGLQACGERVLVIRADVSGIQEFIYRAPSEHALKSLRARSFYLELLAVHALRQLLEIGQVGRANVAYLGGGGFQVYIPAHAASATLACAQRFDDWLWQEHGGTLGFSLASTEVSRQEAAEGGQFQRELSAQLSIQKARRRQGRLASVFAGAESPLSRLNREEALGEALVAFGSLLPGATHVEICPLEEAQGGGWVHLHDRAYRPLRAGPATPLPPVRLALNSFRDAEAFPMLTGNYVTRVRDVPERLRLTQEEGVRSVATHEQLADLALGQPRLALFRCDADNMGQFFSGGIPGHNAARHATLSRLLSLFFQGYVNAICAYQSPLLPGVPQADRAGHGRYLNIIYSGGDDAVVVGAWNEVLSFAVDLRRAYRKFTGGNPLLGLSGGAFIAKAKFPLQRMAERAHDAEQLAKQAREHPGGPRPDKDGFVPFLATDAPGDDPRAAVRWNVFAPLDDPSGDSLSRTLDVLAAFLTLRADNGQDSIELSTRRAFLWKLQAFAAREGDVWRLPQLHYALARATPPPAQEAEWRALQSTLLHPRTWPHLGNVLAFLHLARPTAADRKD